MSSDKVTLDLYEMQSAAHLGILRCLESIKHKEKWGYGYKGSLNVGGVPDLIYKDLRLQVKTQTIKVRNLNSLIIRPKTAKENELYIFCQDQAPDFYIKGFINSSAILGKDKYLTDFGLNRDPCYSVPIEQLTPIFLLKDGTWN